MFADVLFFTAQIDSQLELKEKSYDKVNCWAIPRSTQMAIPRSTPMARPRARPMTIPMTRPMTRPRARPGLGQGPNLRARPRTRS